MIIKTVPVGMLHTNCYLVGDEATNECAIFDPGAMPKKIFAMIEESGMKVKYIILTHCHFDHVMSAPLLQDETGAQILIHYDDSPYLTPEYVNRRGYIRETYKTPNVSRILKDGDEIQLGSITMRVMNTPGHTRGSCVFLFEDVMISGDTLFKGACGRWDLPGGSQQSMMESLIKLHDLSGDYRVLPGHGDATTLDDERRDNPYMAMALKTRK